MTAAEPTAAAAGPGLDELVGRVADTLAAAGVASPAVDARWLVAHVAGADPRRAPARRLDPTARARLDELVRRRAAREPLQLVLGETAFRDLTLVCRPGVFVPRPETEVVAGIAIAAARTARLRPVVGEPCTGTGAIACAVAAGVPDVRVAAGDLDARAVALARHNAARLLDGVAGPAPAPGATIEVRRGALLDALPAQLRGRLDVLVANPPYLPAGDRPTWAPEVAGHDPAGGLVGGDDGHEIVDALVAAAPTWLSGGGTLVLEIDERRAAEAAQRARGAGLDDVEVRADLTGAPRVLVATRRGGGDT